LADEPVFVNAREYLLDEACCEAGEPTEADRETKSRLEALRTHLRKEVRKFLAVDGFGKAERAPRGATKHWTKLPETYSNPRILVPVDGSQQSRWAVRCMHTSNI
jgi:hypothetical protein